MGVYIKDMKMPRECIFCEIWSLCWNIKPYYAGRREDCPLIEVKAPHGRLIDAGTIEIIRHQRNGAGFIEDIYKIDAPTIIEAEVE